MSNLYTLKYILKSGEEMVKCPKCGYKFNIYFECTRCGHKWMPRNPDKKPKVCPNPKCKSPYWDRPRQKRGDN